MILVNVRRKRDLNTFFPLIVTKCSETTEFTDSSDSNDKNPKPDDDL